MSVTITTLSFQKALHLLLKADVVTLDDITVEIYESPTEISFFWENEDNTVTVYNDSFNAEVHLCGNELSFRDEDGEPVNVKLFKLTPVTG